MFLIVKGTPGEASAAIIARQIEATPRGQTSHGENAFNADWSQFEKVMNWFFEKDSALLFYNAEVKP